MTAMSDLDADIIACANVVVKARYGGKSWDDLNEAIGELQDAIVKRGKAEKSDRPRLMTPAQRMSAGLVGQSTALVYGGMGELVAQIIAADRAHILAKARQLPTYPITIPWPIEQNRPHSNGVLAITLDDLAALIEGR